MGTFIRWFVGGLIVISSVSCACLIVNGLLLAVKDEIGDGFANGLVAAVLFKYVILPLSREWQKDSGLHGNT
jgi:hypothetical protein